MNSLKTLLNDHASVALVTLCTIMVMAFFAIVPLAHAQCGFEGQYEYDQGNCGGSGGGSTSPLVLTMTASPTSIQSGQSSTLTWYWTRDDVVLNTMNSSNWSCTINNGVGSVQPASSRSVSPTQSTVYTLTCSYPSTGNQESAQATVTVTQAPPAAPTGLYASCNAQGTAVSFGWNAVSGASYYHPRVNPTAQGECSGAGWTIWSGDGQTCLAPGDVYYGTSVGSFPVIPGKAYSMWVHAGNSAGTSGANTIGFSCQAPVQYPDVVGYVGGAVNATVNQAVTLYGSVYNAGSGTAGNFPTIFQVCDGNCATYNVAVSAGYGTVGSGGSQNVSGSHTPYAQTQLYYRTCANINTSWQNEITETNYGNNCSGWQLLNVSPPANQVPTGSFDAMTCDTAGGWAYDADVPNSAIAVHFYIDGGYAGQMSAGEYRGDLAGYGNRYHGYTWPLPSQFKNNVQHSITVYAIDSAGGSNPALGTRYFTCAPPVVTPNPPTGLTYSCNTAGTQTTMSWTPTPGATYYYPRIAGGACTSGWTVNGGYCIPNTNSIGGNSITFGTTPGTTYSWWVHAGNSAGYSAPTESTLMCTGQADLTPGSAPTVYTTLGSAIPLSGTVSNIGSASTGSGFQNFFVTNASGGVWNSERTASPASGALGSGGAASFSTTFPAGTFSAVGTYDYAYCVDMQNTSWAGTIAESNEGNNCANGFIVVGAPDLTASTGSAQSVVVNQAISLSGSVSNIGTVAAGSFPNIVQVCDPAGCGTYVAAVAATSVSSLAVSGSQVVAGSYTPPTAGSYLYRVCANFNTSYVNVHTESNYGNNCGAWQNLTVQPAVPAAPSSTSATCNAAGTQATISWNASPGATFYYFRVSSADSACAAGFQGSPSGGCYPNPDSYTGTSITYPTTPGRTYNWWVHGANGTGYGGAAYGAVTCAGQADLTAAVGAAQTVVVNQAITLSGTVSNIGSAAAGYFPNFVQVCNASYSACDTSVTNAINSLAAGASAAVSSSYTPSTTDRTQYRVCANMNSSHVNINPESNYGNNCSAWQSLAVYAVPTASLTVSPSSVTYGGSSTISWSSGAATSCTGTNFSTGNATSGSVTVSNLTQATTFTVYCSGAGGTASDAKTVSVGAQQFADLTATTGAAQTVIINEAITLSGTASNIGNAAAGYFPNFIQVCNAAGTACDTSVANAVNSLAVGASTAVSSSYTPSTTDRTQYRLCVNMNSSHVNVHTESNYANNCGGWQTLTVQEAIPAAPTGVTASCNVAGTQATLSWNASAGATSYNPRMYPAADGECTGSGWTLWSGDGLTCIPPGDTYAGTSKVFNTIPGKGYALWTHASNGTGRSVGSPIYNFTCAGQADLTAAPGAAASTLVNEPVTLSGTVTNIGSGATGYFPNFVQVCNNSSCSSFNTDTSRTATAVNSLGAGASTVVSATFTPTIEQNYVYRVCTNFNGSWVNVHTESNYGNNCSAWQTLSVTTPTLSCSVTPTSVASGQSVTYSANPGAGATGPYTWVASDGANVGTGSSATRTLVTPGIYSMNVKGSNTAISYCPNVSVEATWCTNATSNLSITSSRDRVRIGQNATISWSASGVNGEGSSCTVTGPGINWSSAVSASPSCSVSGSAVVTINAQSVYTLSCTDVSEETVIVNVIPNFTEF